MVIHCPYYVEKLVIYITDPCRDVKTIGNVRTLFVYIIRAENCVLCYGVSRPKNYTGVGSHKTSLIEASCNQLLLSLIISYLLPGGDFSTRELCRGESPLSAVLARTHTLAIQ